MDALELISLGLFPPHALTQLLLREEGQGARLRVFVPEICSSRLLVIHRENLRVDISCLTDCLHQRVDLANRKVVRRYTAAECLDRWHAKPEDRNRSPHDLFRVSNLLEFVQLGYDRIEIIEVEPGAIPGFEGSPYGVSLCFM